MPWRSRLSPKSIFLTLSVLLLVLVIACGDAAPATTATEASGMAAERKQAEAAASETGGAEPTPTLFIEVVTRLPATPVPFGDATPTAIPALAPVSEATYGGTLPLHAYTAPTTARPLPEATHSGMISLSPLYNQMVEYNPETDDTLDLRCDLCKTWEISEDGLTRTYHLYEEARWSDGEPLNAEDIIFSIDAIVDPDDPKFGDLWKGHKGRARSGMWEPYYESSRAVDDYTVEIKLKYPSPAFHYALGMEPAKMMPEHAVMKGHLQTFVDTDHLVMSGPFRFVDFTKDVSWEYTKNPDYFKEGRPYLDGVKVFIIIDVGSIIAAYAAEQVLTTTGNNNNIASVESKQFLEDHGDKYNVYFVGPAGSYTFMMNTEKKPFDDSRVRRAMSLGINRQELMDVFGVGDLQLGTPFPPGTWFGPTDQEAEQLPGMRLLNGEKHPDDIAEAKRLLSEAGFPDGFDSEIMLGRSLQYVDVGTVISQQLKKYLNVNLEIRVVEAAAGQAEYEAGTYAVAIQGKSLPFMDPDAGMVEYQDGGLLAKWARAQVQTNWPKLNDIFVRQSRETDPEKRKALIREAGDSLLYEDNAVPAIFYSTQTIFVHKKIQNYHPAPGSYTVGMKYEHLWCDPAC